MTEIPIHILAVTSDGAMQWAYTIEPHHLPMAREIEAEYAAQGTVSGRIEMDRPQVVFHFVTGALKHDDTRRFASALATRMIDVALADQHQGWDDVTGANIRIEKQATGGMTFEVDVIRPAAAEH